MSPRSQSGYDSAGDPRTGRPPLANEQRSLQPEEIEPESFPQSGSSGLSESEDAGTQEGLRTVKERVATSASEAAQTLRSAGEAVTTQVKEATSAAMEKGSALATTASHQVQSYASEFVAFTRRRPLTALIGAATLGMLIGMLRRRRSSNDDA
jgi:ElaB/YqjD/DUF883 family membrane-anchored ribosome-binding protein